MEEGIMAKGQTKSSGMLGMLAKIGMADLQRQQLEPMVNRPWAEFLAAVLVTFAIIAVFQNQHGLYFAVLWGSANFVINGICAIVQTRLQKKLELESDRRKTAVQLSTLSLLQGFSWGSLFVGLLPISTGGIQLLLVWCLAAVLAATAFARWTVPAIALCLITPIAAGGALGMYMASVEQAVPAAIAILMLFAVLMRLVSVTGAAMRKQLAEQQLAITNSETISLLLRDFERDSSDWLWETNAQGILVRGASGFAKSLSISDYELQNCDLAGLVDARTQPLSGLARKTLFQLFQSGQPFNSEVFAVSTSNGERFVRLTAKPINFVDGMPKAWRGVAADVTTEKLAERKVEQLSMRDVLTGLPNRPFFYETFEADLRVTYGQGLWLAVFDIDGFKAINDEHGHSVGDRLLVALAHRLERFQSKTVKIARLSGDEFGVIIHGDLPNVERTWRALSKEIAVPFVVNNCTIDITVSIGIAKCSGLQLISSRIVRMADLALYRAKQEGSGKACFFNEEMDQEDQRKQEFERDFRAAMEHDQFELEYQPICDAQNHEVNCYEALVRWRHPRNGTVPPALFIPLAEETGLIDRLGAWVLRKACEDAMSWPKHIGVSVNVSAVQFDSQKVLSATAHALAMSGLAPSRLTLELTESALLKNESNTRKIMSDLKILGVKMALDDFGTGQSSLYHLQHYNFDTIKIDRSFVLDSVGQSNSTVNSTAIVRAIIQLAGELGMNTVAEGVESAAQLELLVKAGCSEVQGYYLGRPQPAAALLAQGHIPSRPKLLA
jgi:diguanylate cyclase (GGDEF)-like protein